MKEIVMKSRIRYGMAVVALLSSLGVAAAAPSGSSMKASDSLNLTSAQEQTIWEGVSKQDTSMRTPDGFTASIGESVPAKIKLHPLPASVTSKVEEVKPYNYAMLDHETLLIVNPVDKKVVDIIRQ
jgi:hypothetical protein